MLPVGVPECPMFYRANKITLSDINQEIAEEGLLLCCNTTSTYSGQLTMQFPSNSEEMAFIRYLAETTISKLTLSSCSCLTNLHEFIPELIECFDSVEGDYRSVTSIVPEEHWENIIINHEIDIYTRDLQIVDSWVYYCDYRQEFTPELEEKIAKIKYIAVNTLDDRIANIKNHHFKSIRFDYVCINAKIIRNIRADRLIFTMSINEMPDIVKVLEFVRDIEMHICDNTVIQSSTIKEGIPEDIVCRNLVRYEIWVAQWIGWVKVPVLDRWCADNTAARFTRTKAIMPE